MNSDFISAEKIWTLPHRRTRKEKKTDLSLIYGNIWNYILDNTLILTQTKEEDDSRSTERILEQSEENGFLQTNLKQFTRLNHLISLVLKILQNRIEIRSYIIKQ